MKKILISSLLGLFMTSALAAGEDLENCLFNNGIPMNLKSCESLRKRAKIQAADNERGAAINAQRQIEREKLTAEQDANRERQRAEVAAHEQKRLALIEERQLAIDRERREEDKRDALLAKAASERTAKQKSICGDDYRSPRVGMTLVRAKECIADFKLKGQINRADGVVSTYMAGQTYLHVMDGQIVSWGR